MNNPGAKSAMLAIAPALIFVPLMSSYRGYFQGNRDMNKIAISQIAEQFFRVILGIGLAYFLMEGYGPESVSYTHLKKRLYEVSLSRWR